MGLITDEEFRALTFDTSKGIKAPSIFLSEEKGLNQKALATKIFFSKDNRLVGYANLEWEEISRGANGNIVLSARNKIVDLLPLEMKQPEPQEPREGETWYMAAVMGGGEMQKNGKVLFRPNGVQESNGQARGLEVPFVSQWIKAGIGNNKEGRLAVSGTFKFSPMGVLIKVEISNKTDFDYRAYANKPTSINKTNFSNGAKHYLNPQFPRFHLRSSAQKRVAPYYMSEAFNDGLRNVELDFSSRSGDAVTASASISDGLVSLMPNIKTPTTLVGTGANNEVKSRPDKLKTIFDEFSKQEYKVKENYSNSVCYWVWGQVAPNGTETKLGMLEWEFPDLLARGPKFERVPTSNNPNKDNIQSYLLKEKKAYSIKFAISERPSMPTEWILDEDVKQSGSLGHPTGDLFWYDRVVYKWSMESFFGGPKPEGYPNLDDNYNPSSDVLKYIFPVGHVNKLLDGGSTFYPFDQEFERRALIHSNSYSHGGQGFGSDVGDDLYWGSGDGKIYALRLGNIGGFSTGNEFVKGDNRPRHVHLNDTHKLPLYFDGDQYTAYRYEFIDEASPRGGKKTPGKVTDEGKYLLVTTKYIGNTGDEQTLKEQMKQEGFWSAKPSHLHQKKFYITGEKLFVIDEHLTDKENLGGYWGDIFSGIRDGGYSARELCISLQFFDFSKKGMSEYRKRDFLNKTYNKDFIANHKSMNFRQWSHGDKLKRRLRLAKKSLETHQKDIVTWYQYYRKDDGVTDYPDK
ncbi:MAG: hypothetical protein Q4A64_07875 [Porphyromonadaceae bacterium]|nr:hypothetical protein [Porphyromonadaceae bacterium]